MGGGALSDPLVKVWNIYNMRPCSPSHLRRHRVVAHRGAHRGAYDENRIAGFRAALRAGIGFECDVRWSKDGVPVIVHDATLLRTHRTPRRVDAVALDDLRALGVPTLEDVLVLLRDEGAGAGAGAGAAMVMLDLKRRPQDTIRWTRRTCERLGVDVGRLGFLVWSDDATPPQGGGLVFRARGSRFDADAHRKWDGVACKYTGSAVNLRCIWRTLAHGMRLNVYPETLALQQRLLEERFVHHEGCALTLHVDGSRGSRRSRRRRRRRRKGPVASHGTQINKSKSGAFSE